MDRAKAFFVERGHQVAETFVERGYDPEEEVKKHAAADLVILQRMFPWFCILIAPVSGSYLTT
jgi:modulator of drug activity B